MPMGRQTSYSRPPPALSQLEALSDGAGVRGRQERLAILPLCLDIDEGLSEQWCKRLPLLEYLPETGWSKPVGMGAEFSRDGRYDGEDVQIQLRVLLDKASEPLCSAGRKASGYTQFDGL